MFKKFPVKFWSVFESELATSGSLCVCMYLTSHCTMKQHVFKLKRKNIFSRNRSNKLRLKLKSYNYRFQTFFRNPLLSAEGTDLSFCYNSDFLIIISLQPNVVDLRYFKLLFLWAQIILSLKYTIGLQRYRD